MLIRLIIFSCFFFTMSIIIQDYVTPGGLTIWLGGYPNVFYVINPYLVTWAAFFNFIPLPKQFIGSIWFLRIGLNIIGISIFCLFHLSFDIFSYSLPRSTFESFILSVLIWAFLLPVLNLQKGHLKLDFSYLFKRNKDDHKLDQKIVRCSLCDVFSHHQDLRDYIKLVVFLVLSWNLIWWAYKLEIFTAHGEVYSWLYNNLHVWSLHIIVFALFCCIMLFWNGGVFPVSNRTNSYINFETAKFVRVEKKYSYYYRPRKNAPWCEKLEYKISGGYRETFEETEVANPTDEDIQRYVHNILKYHELAKSRRDSKAYIKYFRPEFETPPKAKNIYINYRVTEEDNSDIGVIGFANEEGIREILCVKYIGKNKFVPVHDDPKEKLVQDVIKKLNDTYPEYNKQTEEYIRDIDYTYDLDEKLFISILENHNAISGTKLYHLLESELSKYLKSYSNSVQLN